MSVYNFTTTDNTSWDSTWSGGVNYMYTMPSLPRATVSFIPYQQIVESKPNYKKENTVNVYLIVLVDAMEGEIIRHQIELGKDESGATAALGLTKEEQKKVTRGDWAIVISKLGSYEAPKITRTKSVG